MKLIDTIKMRKTKDDKNNIKKLKIIRYNKPLAT
jgi:hypothetical protein